MIQFICNELVVKNNRSLKNRDQIAVEMEVERSLLGEVLQLEAHPPGTHFQVTITPIQKEV